MCEAPVHEPECGGEGAECDHVVRGDDHSLSNLQWLSVPCHAAKTKLEAAAGLSRRKGAAKLPAEQHPGRISRDA